MPYFLGASDIDFIKNKIKRDELIKEIKKEKAKLKETETIYTGITRGIKLVEEARQAEIIDENIEINLNDINEIIEVLSGLDESIELENDATSSNLGILQDELYKLEYEKNVIKDQIDELTIYVNSISNYDNDINQQSNRLKSIGLFEKLNQNSNCCPFCNHKTTSEIPHIDTIKNRVKELDENLLSIKSKNNYHIEQLKNLNVLLEKIRKNINNKKQQINGIYEVEEQAKKIKDKSILTSRVLGRISLWLESIEILESCDETSILPELESELSKIESLLDIDTVEDNMERILSNISNDMTQFAKHLQLEYQKYTHRFDKKDLTIVVDKDDKSIKLKDLGSGENWLGGHLIALFSIHKVFVVNNRPIPRFIFLDQPSQVYFSNDENDTDSESVEKIYEFIYDRIEELENKLQVIVVDHANPISPKLNDCVIEVWSENSQKLIPNDWINDN